VPTGGAIGFLTAQLQCRYGSGGLEASRGPRLTAPMRTAVPVREGIALSALTLAAGSFAIVGASVNAPLIRVALGLSEIGVGAIASMAYFGAMLTSRAGGRATDRLGPMIVITVGMTMTALGIGLASIAQEVVVFYLGILLAGFGYGAINPATNVLANPTTARRRGLVMSVKQSGVPLGGIVAGAVLPAIGSRYGWRSAFLAPMLACCGVAALTWLAARGRVAVHRRAVEPLGVSVRLRMPHGFAYGFAMAGAQVSVFAFTAVYLVDGRALSINRAGLGVSLLLLAGVLGRPLWGWLSDLYPEQRLRMLQAASLLGAGSISTMWTFPAVVLPVALFAVGLCSVGWNGVYVAVVAEAGEPHEIGLNTGASLRMINLGAVACPVITGLVVQLSHSWAYGWTFCSAVSLFGLVIIAVSRADPRVQSTAEAAQ